MALLNRNKIKNKRNKVNVKAAKFDFLFFFKKFLFVCFKLNLNNKNEITPSWPYIIFIILIVLIVAIEIIIKKLY